MVSFELISHLGALTREAELRGFPHTAEAMRKLTDDMINIRASADTKSAGRSENGQKTGRAFTAS